MDIKSMCRGTDARLTHNLSNCFGTWRFRWTARLLPGAVTVWYNITPRTNLEEQIYGGVKIHSATPMSPFKLPSHDKCEELGGAPCWQDGSSLHFEEHIKWRVMEDRFHPDHEEMWNICIMWAKDRWPEAFPGQEEEA